MRKGKRFEVESRVIVESIWEVLRKCHSTEDRRYGAE